MFTLICGTKNAPEHTFHDVLSDRWHREARPLLRHSSLNALLWSEPHCVHGLLLDQKHTDIHTPLRNSCLSVLLWCELKNMKSAELAPTMCSMMPSGIIWATSTTSSSNSSSTCGMGTSTETKTSSTTCGAGTSTRRRVKRDRGRWSGPPPHRLPSGPSPSSVDAALRSAALSTSSSTSPVPPVATECCSCHHATRIRHSLLSFAAEVPSGAATSHKATASLESSARRVLNAYVHSWDSGESCRSVRLRPQSSLLDR